MSSLASATADLSDADLIDSGSDVSDLSDCASKDNGAEAGTSMDEDIDELASASMLLKRRRIMAKSTNPARELRVPGRNRFRAMRLGISTRPGEKKQAGFVQR